MSDKDQKAADRSLGMDCDINRRDFLNGLAVSAAAPQAANAAAQDQTGYYPPERAGRRGGHPGSCEIAHELRD